MRILHLGEYAHLSTLLVFGLQPRPSLLIANACDRRDVQGEGGTWTPGALMDPALRKRLTERAGLTFSAR